MYIRRGTQLLLLDIAGLVYWLHVDTFAFHYRNNYVRCLWSGGITCLLLICLMRWKWGQEGAVLFLASKLYMIIDQNWELRGIVFHLFVEVVFLSLLGWSVAWKCEMMCGYETIECIVLKTKWSRWCGGASLTSVQQVSRMQFVACQNHTSTSINFELIPLQKDWTDASSCLFLTFGSKWLDMFSLLIIHWSEILILYL
jgi:hypothetical protein